MSFRFVSDDALVHMNKEGWLIHLNGSDRALNLQVLVRDINVVYVYDTYVIYDAYAKQFVVHGYDNDRLVKYLNKKASPMTKFLMNLMTSTTKFMIDEMIGIFVLYARSMLWIYEHDQKTLNTYPIIPNRFAQYFDMDKPLEVRFDDRCITVHQNRNEMFVRTMFSNVTYLIVFPFNLRIIEVLPSTNISVLVSDIITGDVLIANIIGTTSTASWRKCQSASLYLYYRPGLYTIIDGKLSRLRTYSLDRRNNPAISIIK